MQYPLAAAAAQVENFEALNNEGLWVTPEALGGIEARLQELTNAQATAAETTAAAVSAQEAAEASLATANETITANQATIDSLNARIAELEADDTDITLTRTEGDDFQDNQEVPFHASKENPMNAIADRLIIPKKKD